MTTISSEMIKDLRERTGVGMLDCKKALAESNGDFEKAVSLLRQKGLATAAKKAGELGCCKNPVRSLHGQQSVGIYLFQANRDLL